MENVGYLENTLNEETAFEEPKDINEPSNKESQEDTPKLFSDDEIIDSFQEEENKENDNISDFSENLLEEENNEEEDYEIPAFLRKQKN